MRLFLYILLGVFTVGLIGFGSCTGFFISSMAGSNGTPFFADYLWLSVRATFWLGLWLGLSFFLVRAIVKDYRRKGVLSKNETENKPE